MHEDQMTSPKTSAAQSPGALYAGLWRDAVAAIETLWASERSLVEREREARDGDKDSFGATVSSVFGRHRIDLKEAAEDFVDTLCNVARVRFTPKGHDWLNVDAHAYKSRFVDPLMIKSGGGDGRRRFHANQFDPEAIWQALEEDYGGDKAQEITLRAAARTIGDYFPVGKGRPVNRRKGGISLSVNVYVDRYGLGEPTLDWHCQQSLASVLAALNSFATWSGDDGTMIAGLSRARRMLCSHGYHVISRDQIRVCDDLIITTYKSRFDWWLSDRLGLQLQLFMGKYGHRANEAA